MFETADVPLRAGRWVPFAHEIHVEGVDLTGATFAAQVRDRKDGGVVRADLATVTSASAEGVRLAGVDVVDGVTTSRIALRINETTMDAMSVAEDRGAPGTDATIWWDMHITPAGALKFRAFAGSFTIQAGVTQ